MAEGGYRHSVRDWRQTREFSLHFPLFVISAGSLDSSGTERDEMDTWINESLITLLRAFGFSFPSPKHTRILISVRLLCTMSVALYGSCCWIFKKRSLSTPSFRHKSARDVSVH